MIGLGFLVICGIAVGSILCCTTKSKIAVGQLAPDFSLADDKGNLHSLASLRGRSVVLYFYPKAETPGCTKEACSLRDNYGEFNKKNAVVLGVSYDTVKTLASFKKNHNLPFILLSDAKKEVAKLYGANRIWFLNFVPKRMTFIIDPQGKITHIMPDVSVDSHAEEVLKFLDAQKK
jgi:peroxiredoxin Q/BCP